MPVLIAALSALMYGAADFYGGLAAKKNPLFTVLLYSQFIGLLIALVAAPLIGAPFPGGRDIVWGAVAGVFGTIGIGTLYRALATTIVAVASPIAALAGAAIPVVIGVTMGERPGMLAWLGIAAAAPAIVLLTAGPAGAHKEGVVRRAALLGAGAGISFGLFFVAISRTSHASGLWPLVAARLSTMMLMGGVALIGRRSPRVSPANAPQLLIAGALDMGANIAFLLASRSGMLSIVAVISALYPGPTVLLARVVLKEKLTGPRIAGLALALAGVALISV
jgi:drug/metabolite transporter (DMT)-like permease